MIVDPPLPARGILIAQNLQLTQGQLDAIRSGATPYYRVYGVQGYRTVGSHSAARQVAIIAHGEPVLSIMTLKAVRSLPGASLAAINTQSTALAIQDMSDASGGFFRDALIGGAIFLAAGVAGAAALSAGAAGSGAGAAAATDTSITAASTTTTSTLTDSAITDAFGAAPEAGTGFTAGGGAFGGGEGLGGAGFSAGGGSFAGGEGLGGAAGAAGGAAGAAGGGLGQGLAQIGTQAAKHFGQMELAKFAAKYMPHPNPTPNAAPAPSVAPIVSGGIDPVLLALGAVATFLIF